MTKSSQHWFEGRLVLRGKVEVWSCHPCILALRRVRDRQNEGWQPVARHYHCTGCPSDCLVRWPGPACNHMRGIPTLWLGRPSTERLEGCSWVCTPYFCASTPCRPFLTLSRNLISSDQRMQRHDLRFKFRHAKHHSRISIWWQSVRKMAFDDPSGVTSCCFYPVCQSYGAYAPYSSTCTNWILKKKKRKKARKAWCMRQELQCGAVLSHHLYRRALFLKPMLTLTSNVIEKNMIRFRQGC